MFAVIFPLNVGNLIEQSDPLWPCFILLLQISKIVFLDSISDLEIVLLEHLIEELLMDYKDNFFLSYKKQDPKSLLKCRIIPKMHHLVHYLRFIKSLGPFKPFWSMRFEAKHSCFKFLERKI